MKVDPSTGAFRYDITMMCGVTAYGCDSLDNTCKSHVLPSYVLILHVLSLHDIHSFVQNLANGAFTLT
jgi:hypothetical protein